MTADVQELQENQWHDPPAPHHQQCIGAHFSITEERSNRVVSTRSIQVFSQILTAMK